MYQGIDTTVESRQVQLLIWAVGVIVWQGKSNIDRVDPQVLLKYAHYRNAPALPPV